MAVYCIEFFYAKPGCVDQLKAALEALAEVCRQEQGCLQYEVLVDKENPLQFILIVCFEDDELMKRHEEQSYIQAFAENEMKRYCEKVEWFDAFPTFRAK